MMFQVGDDGVVSSVDEEDLIYVDKNELEQLVESYHKLEEENEQLKDALKQRTEQCDKYYEENEKLKKGMIGVVDRYIKNVDCNPPSSAHTYMKIKGALLNVREDLRDLLEDLE